MEITPPGTEPLEVFYLLKLAEQGPRPRIAESLEVRQREGGNPRPIFQRTDRDARVWNGSELVPLSTVKDSELLLTELSGALTPHPAIPRFRDALAAIEVHLPFEVTPSWASRAYQRPSAARSAVVLQPAERLEVFGRNLANAFFTLRNEFAADHWQATMDFVRLGLGGDVESVNTRADPGGGSVALTLKLSSQPDPLPAHALSDGQLAYLCFVALYRLDQRRSLLAFDEPELHMHPELLVRVVQILEDLATQHPVLIATHSDVLLDALASPVDAVRVCELMGSKTRVRQLDAAALATWLERYRGVGHLRSEGYLSALLADAPAESEPGPAERAGTWAHSGEGAAPRGPAR
jgi:predicted ATPase